MSSEGESSAASASRAESSVTETLSRLTLDSRVNVAEDSQPSVLPLVASQLVTLGLEISPLRASVTRSRLLFDSLLDLETPLISTKMLLYLDDPCVLDVLAFGRCIVSHAREVTRSLFGIFDASSDGNFHHFHVVLLHLLTRAPVDVVDTIIAHQLLAPFMRHLRLPRVAQTLVHILTFPAKDEEATAARARLHSHMGENDNELWDLVALELFRESGDVDAAYTTAHLVERMCSVSGSEDALCALTGRSFVDPLVQGLRSTCETTRASAGAALGLIAQAVFNGAAVAPLARTDADDTSSSPDCVEAEALQPNKAPVAFSAAVTLYRALAARASDLASAAAESTPGPRARGGTTAFRPRPGRRAASTARVHALEVLARMAQWEAAMRECPRGDEDEDDSGSGDAHEARLPSTLDSLSATFWRAVVELLFTHSHNNLVATRVFSLVHAAVMQGHTASLDALLARRVRFLSRISAHYLAVRECETAADATSAIAVPLLNVLRLAVDAMPGAVSLRAALESSAEWADVLPAIREDALSQTWRQRDGAAMAFAPLEPAGDSNFDEGVDLGSSYARALGFLHTRFADGTVAGVPTAASSPSDGGRVSAVTERSASADGAGNGQQATEEANDDKDQADESVESENVHGARQAAPPKRRARRVVRRALHEVSNVA